jgi:flagellar basal body-associated protein FliL
MPDSAESPPQSSSPRPVSGADTGLATGPEISRRKLADLDAQLRTARGREALLWVLFVVVFVLTLAAASAGVALVFVASLKVGIASGAAAVLPGCTSAMLKRECSARSKIRQDIEAKRDEEFRLRQAAAAIAELPEGPQKKNLQTDYARKMLSRIPK